MVFDYSTIWVDDFIMLSAAITLPPQILTKIVRKLLLSYYF